MKGEHEDILKNFFGGIVNDNGEEFREKITGYCCIYAPYYICMLESDDGEYLEFCLKTIQNEIGKGMHEQVWCLLATEEVPSRAFDDFEVKSIPAA
jgi:hypothetical protein